MTKESLRIPKDQSTADNNWGKGHWSVPGMKWIEHFWIHVCKAMKF